MNELSLKEQKKTLRKRIMDSIAALDPAYTVPADEAITGHLLSLPEYQEAQTVFCFVGMEHEINTRPFLQRVLEDQKVLTVPLCLPHREMQARQIRSLDELKEGHFGILEPAADTPCIPPSDISFAVIPCVSCSHNGVRLGHGGGYYDIYFSKASIPTAMICRERIICEEIPTEEHDLIFPVVITEEGVFRR